MRKKVRNRDRERDRNQRFNKDRSLLKERQNEYQKEF